MGKALFLIGVIGFGFSACSADIDLPPADSASGPQNPPDDPTPTTTPTSTPTPSVTPIVLPNSSQACLPEIANVVPNLLVFEKQIPGGNQTMSFVVSNGGSDDLTLQSITSPSSIFQISGFAGATILSPGEELPITVRFSPSSTGTFTGLIYLNFVELAQPKTVEVWGAGIAAFDPRPLSGCGTLAAAGATYTLQNDISASGSCLSITAANVTLDLNGHTVSYSNASGSPATCNISGTPNANCGIWVGAQGSVIKNGTVLQGAGAAPRDHAIYLGGGANYSDIEGTTITVSSTSSSNIAGEYKKGIHIHGNTLVSHVRRTLLTRTQIADGTLIQLGNDALATTYPQPVRHSIHDNVMIGGLQTVINIYSIGSQIYRNDISHDGIITNDFAIFLEGYEIEVFQNHIHPTDGRGIHVVGHGHVVRDNIIDVRELPRNCEVTVDHPIEECTPGCQAKGTYGIQIEGRTGSSTHSLIFGNDITAHADECEAQALRVSEASTSHRVCNNNFVTSRTAGSSVLAPAASFAAVTADDDFLIKNNLFMSDDKDIYLDWEGATGLRFTENTFERGPNAGSGFFLLKMGNGSSPISDIHLIDSVLGAGVDTQKTNWWRSDNEYFLRWTLDLTVNNSSGQPLNNAQVTIRDAMGNVAFSGTTSGGKVSPLLAQFRKVHTTGAASDVTTTYTPHTITITPSGGSAYSVPGSVTMDGRKSLTVTAP